MSNDTEPRAALTDPRTRSTIGWRVATVLARLMITVVIVGAVIIVVGWADIASTLSSASPAWLAVMYASALLRQAVDAVQFRYMLQGVGTDLGLRRVFLASQLASFYSLVVPGDIAASAAKWTNLSLATGKRSLMLNAMLYNKLLLLAAPILIGAAALAIDNPFDSAWMVLLAFGVFGAVAVAMLGLYHPSIGRFSDRVVRRVARSLPSGVETRVGYLLDSMAQIRSLLGRDHAVMFGLMLAGVSIGVFRFYAGIRALGLEVPLIGVLWVIAFLAVARMLPLTVANLGIREGLLVFALAVYDVPAGQAVALGLLGFSALVMLAIIGGIYQVSLIAGWVSARVEEPGAASEEV